jgi:hypothetical protein
MEILKEITEWNTEGIPSNHTYLINKKGQIVAFAKWHSDDIQVLKSRPYMDKRYRKFVKDNHSKLSDLIRQFKSEDEIEKENKSVIKLKNVRTFKVKSNSKDYTITFNTTNKHFNCNCVGFGYRSICKHVNFVKENYQL